MTCTGGLLEIRRILEVEKRKMSLNLLQKLRLYSTRMISVNLSNPRLCCIIRGKTCSLVCADVAHMHLLLQ